MKSYKNLYPQIADFSSLYFAWKKARRNKRYTPTAAQFERNLDSELLRLHRALNDESWKPGGYVHFIVHEPKRRLISAAPFRDRVVHHALVGCPDEMVITSPKRYGLFILTKPDTFLLHSNTPRYIPARASSS